MIVSTIIITVKYANDATMEEAKDDEAEFQHEIERQFLRSVGSKEDIHVDYTTAEVTSSPAKTSHSHFGEMFEPDTCPACRILQRGID
jgi:hypothetical protein